MVLRPDERASLSEIEREERFQGNLRGAAKSGAALGGGLLGSGVASRVLPFLSEYIPTDLAIKGISKISPPIGDFLKRGMSMGLDAKEGLKFVKDEVDAQAKPAKESRNLIEQYSPELHQFLTEQIQSGQPPLQAAALAGLEGKATKGFKRIIDKLVKDHKTPFASIVQTVYGSPEQPLRPGSQTESEQGVDPEFEKIIQGGAALLKKFRG